MMMKQTKRRGFSLTECLVLVVVLGLLVAVLAPMLGAARSRMRGLSSAEKLMQIGVGGAMYANDNAGRMFGYSWRAGEAYTMPDGRVRHPTSDQEAGAYQNEEILMRRTGRLNGIYKILNFSSRLPHRRYGHLVLLDYLGQSTESDAYIDPSDGKQLYWTANPLDYGFGTSSVPYANGIYGGYDNDPEWSSNTVRQRWAFASSYQMVVDAWQRYTPGNRYIPIESTPHLFMSNGTPDLHTGHRMNAVLHPSNKVWMFEEFDRDRQQPLYFGYDEARSDKLMFDGSVNNWASGDAAPSVVIEHGLKPWVQRYVPLDRFPLPVGGLGDPTLLSQRYRWTYGGVYGINYGNFGGGN